MKPIIKYKSKEVKYVITRAISVQQFADLLLNHILSSLGNKGH